MKKMMKLLSALLALLMIFALCACGGGDDTDDLWDSDVSDETLDMDAGAEDKEITGEKQGHGDYAAILVPEDFSFVLDSWDETNPHYVEVKRSDFAYFDFTSSEDESTIQKDYEYNKKTYTNEQTDVSATCNGIEWTGFQYGDGFGGYGFEAYTKIGSFHVRVSSAGFKFDDPIAQAVLGSVEMN